MDRRNFPGAVDEQLRYEQALGFLAEVRSGMTWERFCLHAIGHFDALLDLLNGTEKAAAFLSAQKIDQASVVEKTREIFNRIHFNRENDFYLVLGLPRTATDTQIHERWKGLMSLYHPDRNRGDDENAARCVRRVNEAFSVLKNPRRKLEYDRSLLRPVNGPQFPEKRVFSEALRPRESYLSPAGRRVLAKLIVPLSLAFSLIILIVIFLQNKPVSRSAEQVVVDGRNAVSRRSETRKEPLPVQAPAVPVVTEERPTEVREIQTPKRETPREKRVEVTESEKRTAPRREEAAGSPVKAMVASVPETAAGRGRNEERVTAPQADEPSRVQPERPLPESRQAPAPESGEKRDRQEQKRLSGEPDRNEQAKHAPAPRGTARNVDNEIYLFLGLYVNAYERGDIDEFLSLFSRTARENDRMNYDEIRRAYQRNFDKKKYKYTIKDVRFAEDGDKVVVTGTYQIQNVTGNAASVASAGSIRWTLIREGGGLKINRVDYERN